MGKPRSWDRKETQALLRAILHVRNLKEAKMFFRDLLTEAELEEFANRWKTARLLSKGLSYAAIEEETGMSSTTIARIQKWVKRGTGGYRLILNRIKR